MKTFILFTLTSITPILVFAQHAYKPLKAGWAKYLEKQTVFVKQDTLLAGKYEVSNIEYRQFLNDLLKHGNRQQYETYEIDSNGWSNYLTFNMPYVHYYHRHSAYQDYPVVNITHEAAVAFCDWLTIQYNNDPKRKYKKVKIKLPDEQEWKAMFTSNGKYTFYPWAGTSTRDRKGIPLANFMVIPDYRFKRLNSGAIILDTMKTNAAGSNLSGKVSFFMYTNWPSFFPPNALGCYNVAGNVSEMLATKGVRKGGSFISPGYYLTLNADEEFPLLEKGSMIGFRYFVEVIEK